MIKAIIFDCFGVLYVSSGKLFYETYVPNYLKHKERLHELSRQCDYGFISQQELAAQVAELSGLEPAFVVEHIEGKKVRNEPLLKFSQSLRPDIKVGLLSNIGAGGIESYFSTSEREKLFDAAVLSSEAGMVKPFPEIYLLMAEKLQVYAGECVMVDDSEENCAGADAAGMRSIVYENNENTLRAIDNMIGQ